MTNDHMTNDPTPVDTAVSRAPYERPVVIELTLAGATDGKSFFSLAEFAPSVGPS